jgi:hypothetical protein
MTATKTILIRDKGKAYAVAITREDEDTSVAITLPSGDVIHGMHGAGGLDLSDYTVAGARCPITGDLYDRVADRVESVCEDWDWTDEGDEEDEDED